MILLPGVKNILWLILLLSSNVLCAQQGGVFTLKGSINANSGTIELRGICQDCYEYKNFISTKISDGHFSFTDTIAQPSAYMIGVRIGSELKYISGIFYVDTGAQDIVCDLNAIRAIPAISNRIMAEWNQDFKPVVSVVRDKNRYNNTLLQYAKEHPDSYIVLWTLVEKMKENYLPVFDSIYNALSEPVRQSYTGLHLIEKLRAIRQVATGNIMPELTLPDKNKNSQSISEIAGKNKYTLVDFWYSSCYPCRRQFPAFKKAYAAYMGSGFEIVGVSIDGKESIAVWEQLIDEDELNWIQLLDQGGINAAKFSITSYPTNFLLDNKGTIMRKDIGMTELDTLLKELDK